MSGLEKNDFLMRSDSDELAFQVVTQALKIEHEKLIGPLKESEALATDVLSRNFKSL